MQSRTNHAISEGPTSGNGGSTCTTDAECAGDPGGEKCVDDFLSSCDYSVDPPICNKTCGCSYDDATGTSYGCTDPSAPYCGQTMIGRSCQCDPVTSAGCNLGESSACDPATGVGCETCGAPVCVPDILNYCSVDHDKDWGCQTVCYVIFSCHSRPFIRSALAITKSFASFYLLSNTSCDLI